MHAGVGIVAKRRADPHAPERTWVQDPESALHEKGGSLRALRSEPSSAVTDVEVRI